MARPKPLPGCAWVNEEDAFVSSLRDALWPSDTLEARAKPQSSEPPSLLRYIETWTPVDDRWLTGDISPQAMEGEGVAWDDTTDFEALENADGVNDGEDIQYIDLHAHPVFAIFNAGVDADKRGSKAMFVVREEYRRFMQHAISCVVRQDRLLGKFLSSAAITFLFWLLALGQPVFLLPSLNEVFYFSRDGIQKSQMLPRSQSAIQAIKQSWVLIDIDGQFESTIYEHARCVIWTSSPQESRMRMFQTRFRTQSWYMKAWGTKEIAAVTDRYGIRHDTIRTRLDMSGPVARSLFGGMPAPSAQTIEAVIKRALRDGLFSFRVLDTSGLFLIQPLVVRDESTGQACIQRTDYSVEFLSTYITERLLDLVQERFETVKDHLTMAFDLSLTRTAAGKLVEGLMHRTLTSGMPLPNVFGAQTTVAKTSRLSGNVKNFSCEAAIERPLYLQPRSSPFAPVDAILVTNGKLGLLQTSLSDSHSPDFAVMLQIMARLQVQGGVGVNLNVSGLDEVIYCLVGTEPDRVKRRVVQARAMLEELKGLDSKSLSKRLGLSHTVVGHTGLKTFCVLGYTFHPLRGFEEIRVV
ncbi:hypothetical protein C8F01DRAFT_1106926 [Mycena amicta]|nr:hypothetical protein C8F01DRAFT_1106926 [Mycena amicta]